MKKLSSSVFKLEPLPTSQGVEQIVRGSRLLFPKLKDAFEGIRTIVVVGWGSQGPAQAQNLRDTLRSIGSNIVVKVALRNGSEHRDAARAAGFQVSCELGEETLGSIEEVVPQGDMVLLLISDGAQTEHWKYITGLMKPGSTLGLSHGFLLGHLETQKEKLRDDINVILVAPKGMGDSVRRIYLQGQEVDGAGINSSVAVEQDVNGRAYDYAIGWSIAIGSPVTFFTTMRNEYVSDLTGERGMLLGTVWGMVEAIYAFFLSTMRPDEAFLASAKGLTSTVVRGISELGLKGFYESLTPSQKEQFRKGYFASILRASGVIDQIYNSVSGGQEVREVVVATERLKTEKMSEIETSDMWKVAAREGLYSRDVPMSDPLAFAAGMYVGGLMAGIDVLIARGHSVSEAINEQLIEGLDSLMPYMDKRGLRAMVEGCSVTARLGTRKWGPVAEKAFSAGLRDEAQEFDFSQFLNSPIHGDVAACFALRPTVKLILN
jgi:ketol-acid reductoisomerase